MKSLEKSWSDEDCGGVREAGDDTWHKSRAEAVGLSPDAVTAIAAMAHLCVEDVLMCFKDFVVSLSSPLSGGTLCEGTFSFFYMHDRVMFN